MKSILPAMLAVALLATPCQAAAQAAADATPAVRWSRAPDAAIARQEIYPAVLGDRIIVAGGVLSQPPGFTDHVEAYDVKAGRWTTLAPLPEGRHHIALAEAGGRIYGIGGFSGAIPDWRAHATVFVYDAEANRWSAGPSLPGPRAEGVVATVRDRIYFIGGRVPTSPEAVHINAHADTARGEALDTRTKRWERIPDAPSARNSAAAAVIDDKIYVVGGRQMLKQADGRQRPVNLATLEVYDPVTKRWETRAPMPQAQGGLAVAAYDGKLYAFGGEQFVPASKVFPDAWVYDPKTDRWSALPAMPTPRHGHGAAVVGNRIFLMGGGEKVGVGASRVLEVLEIPAERRLDEGTVQIDGQQRRYFRLHDAGSADNAVPILLISGSGCRAFGQRIPAFFQRYPAPVDVYFLEKAGIEKGDDGTRCSAAYRRADYLERRVEDALAFIDKEPRLKRLAARKLAILGFSEGGMVAPIVASRSTKIGWLATGGSGGLPQSEEFLIFNARGVVPYATLFTREQLLQTYAAIKADPHNVDKEFFGNSYRYWSSHLFYDPLSAYAALTIPIVAAMGEKDDSVPIESGRKLRDYFAARPNKNFTFIEYPKAGHALRTPDKDHLPEFVAGLAQWFKGKQDAFK